jgi:hypothetical protein
VGQRPSLNQTEPAMIRAVVMAILGMLGVVGLKLAPEDQDALINAAIVLVPLLFLAYGWWVRRNVYAPATVRDVQAEAFQDGLEVATNNGGGVGGVDPAVPGVVPDAVGTSKIPNGATFGLRTGREPGVPPESPPFS